MEKQKIRITKKMDEYSMEYQAGDIFTVDSTWYGGVNVTSRSGIPISLDKDEYQVIKDEGLPPLAIDPYSYELGVMDCLCEMVASGLKKLAMSHPWDTREERDSYLGEVKKLCSRYGVMYYQEDRAFITDLFPENANKNKFNYLFFLTEDVLQEYLALKERQE